MNATLKVLISTIFTVFLLFIPASNSFAGKGCCSSHGGVVGCDKSSGYEVCKDGTNSPSCKCESSDSAVAATKPAKATKTTKEPKAAKETKAAKAAKTETAAETTASTKGCCSGHGGISKCDKATGYQICKDGSHSTTCTCAKNKVISQ